MSTYVLIFHSYKKNFVLFHHSLFITLYFFKESFIEYDKISTYDNFTVVPYVLCIFTLTPEQRQQHI